MDFIKKEINVCNTVLQGCSELGVDGDIIVPDVLPDMLKIIQVDGEAHLTGYDVSDGNMSCTGKLELKILYIPDSGDEKIKSVITALDFSHAMSNGKINESLIAELYAEASRVDFQPVNSRKIRIKSAVSLNYCFRETRRLEIPYDTEDNLEMQRHTVNTSGFTAFRDTQFLVRESLQLPSGQKAINELLKLDTSVCDTEFKVISGRVVVKGFCAVCALYTDTDGCVRYSDFEIPFTEIIELEDANDDTVCEIDFSPGDVTCRLESDSGNENRMIYTEILVNVRINAYENTELEYIGDCYCPGYETELETEEQSLECIPGRGMATITVREVIPTQKNAPSLSSIYNVIAKPVIENARAEDGRICVEGKILCYCLYICSGDEMPVYSVKKEIGFCEYIEAEGCTPGCDCRVRADIVHKNSILNSAGETELKLNVSFEVKAVKTVCIPVITSCTVSEIDASDKKGIVIYFVRNGDSLWEVSKRYKVHASAIAELNNLETEELTNGMKLLIPSA